MKILALWLLLFVTYTSLAATIPATTCSNANVNTAISAASSGDTVTVPAGSCSWSSVSIPDNKKLTLQGAGIGNTIISGMPDIGQSGSRVTGFTFQNGTTEIEGNGFRFDHNRVTSSTWTDCIKVRDWTATITQMPWGLIDNNQFVNCRVNAEGTPYMYGDDSGRNQHELWRLAHDFGGQNSVYLEQNTFELTYAGNFNYIDANYGGTFVARYNTLYDGGFMETHSAQEGGNRAGKSFEIYGNVISLRNDYSSAGGMSERWRGGTGYHFMNSYVGTWFNPGIMLDAVGSYASRSGCGLCNGASACDGNQNGTGWPCRDQIGRGPDNPRWTSSPIGAYTQPSVPTYLWSNRNGSSNYPAVVIDWSSSHIQANRDFYDYNASFNGTTGTGCGTVGNRPATCTTGVAYWQTTQSCTDLTGRVGHTVATPISGTLYKCTATNTWTAGYTPLAFPHPLAGGGLSDQTISFSAPTGCTTTATCTASATATSGLTVTFASTTPTQCTATGTNGATITGLLSGTNNCTITADQAGNGSYNAAPQVTRTFSISKTAQTISFSAPSGCTTTVTCEVAATATSSLTVAFTSLTESACSVAGTTVTGHAPAASCQIAANQAGDATYSAAAQVIRTFSIAATKPNPPRNFRRRSWLEQFIGSLSYSWAWS